MSVSVNCWYCSEDSLVPADRRHSWECPKCDQFNSFTSNGDVAPSAAAAGAQPRAVRYNVAVRPAAAAAARWRLCHRCNLQQQLKTRQLAEFRPVLEQRWEQELEEYQRHLERVYQPCVHCQAVVASALREADDRVRPAWLDWLRRRQPAVKDSGSDCGPAVVPASSRSSWLAAAARDAAVKAGAVARGASAKLCRVFGVGMTLSLPNGLLVLLLLLCNSCLVQFGHELVPEQYRAVLVDVEDVFSEDKDALVMLCFTLWVFVTKEGLSVQTLTGLLLWATVFVVEISVDQYIADSTVAALQAVLVSVLLVLSVKGGHGSWEPATGAQSGPSTVLEPAPSSSTPKVAANGVTGGHRGPLSNGHAPAVAPVTPPGGSLPSPMPSGSLPSPIPSESSSPQAEYDYNLPRLSLGSPRKPAGSGGVFALRTYQPASGSALFSGSGRGRPAPLLSPSRLRSELHHSAWIAGGYWQRGQPSPAAGQPQLLSRSSSQSSGFVDACGPLPSAPAGSVLGEDDPRGWAGSQCDARSCAGDTWTHPPSYVGSQRSEWRSCSGDWRGRVAPAVETRGCGPSASPDSSSLLSDRSLLSHRTATSGLSESAVSHRSLLVAVVLGFSIAFNMFALLLLIYRDRL